MTDIENNNISTLCSDPEADLILQLIVGDTKFKLMSEAIELGIFDALEMCPEAISARAFATKHDYDPDITERLFNTLACIGLLHKDKTKKGQFIYKNSTPTSRYLTRAKSPTLLGVTMINRKQLPVIMSKLPHVLTNGSTKTKEIIPPTPPQDNTKLGMHTGPSQLMNVMGKYSKTNLNQQPPQVDNGMKPAEGEAPPSGKAMEFARSYLLMTDGFAATCASALVTAFDLYPHRVAVDLGGGSGRIAVELSDMYPEMEVVVYDFPHVIQMAQKMPHNQGRQKLSFQSGDFLQDELPNADLYIMAHVIHGLNEKYIDIILEKIFKQLPKGGSLLVMEKLMSEDKSGPEWAVTNDVILSLLTEGRERTHTEYKNLFRKHGFTYMRTKQIEGYSNYDAIIVKKPF